MERTDAELYSGIYRTIKFIYLLFSLLTCEYGKQAVYKGEVFYLPRAETFSCLYCDAIGESYIEASDKTIMRVAKAIIPAETLRELVDGGE